MSQTLLKKTTPTGVETESERFCGPQTEPRAGSSLAAPLVARLQRPQPRPAEVHLHTGGGASLAHPPWASGPTAGARGPSLQQCARGSRRRRWSEESTLGAALFSGVRFEKTFRCRLSRPRAGWGRTQISCSLLCCVGAIGGRATRTSSLGTRWDAGWGAARARTAPAPRHARSVRGGEQRRTQDAGRTAAGAEPRAAARRSGAHVAQDAHMRNRRRAGREPDAGAARGALVAEQPGSRPSHAVFVSLLLSRWPRLS